MKRKHHTPEQIVRKIAEGEKLLNEGRDVAEVCPHLEITESTGAIGHLESRGRDAFVDLGPGSRRAVALSAGEAPLVPHEDKLSTNHREIDEGHQASILHDCHHSASGTPHDLALKFEVHFGDHGLVIDLNQPDTLEIDEEQVLGNRVGDQWVLFLLA